MTPREQRKQRKEWRKIKQNQRKKKKQEVKALTPLSSPVDISQREHHSTTRKKRAIAKCY